MGLFTAYTRIAPFSLIRRTRCDDEQHNENEIDNDNDKYDFDEPPQAKVDITLQEVFIKKLQAKPVIPILLGLNMYFLFASAYRMQTKDIKKYKSNLNYRLAASTLLVIAIIDANNGFRDFYTWITGDVQKNQVEPVTPVDKQEVDK